MATTTLDDEGEGGGRLQWEWCGDSLSWTAYPASTSALIEAAFQSGKPTVEFSLSHSTYSIHFQPLQSRQKNLATGRTRAVKRQEAIEGTFVSWLWWENESQSWHAYGDELARQIEEAWQESYLSNTSRRQKGPAGVFFVTNGHTYSIEFETDGVQYNLKTQFARGVRRNLCSRSGNMQGTSVGTSVADASSVRQGRRPDEGSSNISSTLASMNGALHNIVHPRTSSLTSENIGGPSYDSTDIVDLANPSDSEDCSICLSGLQERGAAALAKCKHSFHRDCIESWFKNRPTCPECLTVYGTIIGTQPPGEMHVQYITCREAKPGLAGFPNTDVIKITYTFRSGIQNAEHPNPGKPYSGTVRTAYLPKNTEGEEVLELLKRAWSCRLLFRIGTSVTTGQNDVVTWASVHHKTRMSGGSSHHGYPDDTYFARVKKELEEVGIV